MSISIEHQWVKTFDNEPKAMWTFHFPEVQTPGHLNAVLLKWLERNAKVRSISDTAGNDYSVADVGPGVALYYAPSIVGAAANCVTVVFDQPVSLVGDESKAAEFSGVPLNPILSADSTRRS